MLTATVLRTPLASVTAFSVALRLEVVLRLTDGEAGGGRETRADHLRERNVTPNAGADGRPAERDLAEFIDGVTQPPNRPLHLPRMAQKLLAEPDGRCVLQVRAACLDDVPKGCRFVRERLLQALQCGHEFYSNAVRGGDLYSRRDDVVGGLTAIDVVVGMNHAGADLAAENLRRAIGDDLVCVHVGGRAGASLEDIEHEMVVMLAVHDFLRGRFNRRRCLQRDAAEFLVDLCGGALDQREGPDEAA